MATWDFRDSGNFDDFRDFNDISFEPQSKGLRLKPWNVDVFCIEDHFCGRLKPNVASHMGGFQDFGDSISSTPNYEAKVYYLTKVGGF
jgi:hypothetical protein